MTSMVHHEARAEFLFGSTKVGVLVIHGFTGSTQSMRLVAYALHKHGYSVSLPRLKGHGTSPEDMATTTYHDWINSVTDAYNELKERVDEVFVFGLSMGGTLTLYSAINFNVRGAITVNAAIELKSFADLCNDQNSPDFLPSIGSDIKKRDVKEWAYDKTPKKCCKELVALTDVIRPQLSQIECPFLIFSSLEDHVVPPANQKYIFSHIRSKDKELIELKNSYHVATLDFDLDLIVSKTIDFIEMHQ